MMLTDYNQLECKSDLPDLFIASIVNPVHTVHCCELYYSLANVVRGQTTGLKRPTTNYYLLFLTGEISQNNAVCNFCLFAIPKDGNTLLECVLCIHGLDNKVFCSITLLY